MRHTSKRALREDLRAVRQEILFRLQETEAAVPSPTCSPTVPPTEQPPEELVSIAHQVLDVLGGGQFVIMKRGAQTIQQRAQELAEEDERQRHRRW